MIRVCTGFSPKGFEEYGKRFLDSFAKHWPSDVELNVYVEEIIKCPRGRVISLFECGGVGDFIKRHRDDPEKNGRLPNDKWKERHKRGGYNFRFDAVKFCRQCFIPRQSVRYMADGDVMIWLDADVVTFDTPPKDFGKTLIGDADIAFLGRTGMHSEIGYWSIRVNERTRRFVNRLASIWETDEVFSLPEWHSAFVFDHVRSEMRLIENNLTPGGRGHVWFQSPLGKYTDHCKGARKAAGISPERKHAGQTDLHRV
jgi:hypothetical protein